MLRKLAQERDTQAPGSWSVRDWRCLRGYDSYADATSSCVVTVALAHPDLALTLPLPCKAPQQNESEIYELTFSSPTALIETKDWNQLFAYECVAAAWMRSLESLSKRPTHVYFAVPIRLSGRICAALLEQQKFSATYDPASHTIRINTKKVASPSPLSTHS